MSSARCPRNTLTWRLKNMAKLKKSYKYVKWKSDIGKLLIPLVLWKRLENITQLTRSHDWQHCMRLLRRKMVR